MNKLVPVRIETLAACHFGFAPIYLGNSLDLQYSEQNVKMQQSFDSAMAYEQTRNERRQKVEKREVDYYSRGSSGSHCGKLREADTGFCKNFLPHRNDTPSTPGLCRLVKGEIARTHWCQLYSAAFPAVRNLPRRVRTKNAVEAG